MTETIFAGEQVETFSQKHALILFALFGAPVAWLEEDFLVGNCPGDTGYGQGECKKPYKLGREHKGGIKN